MRFHGVFLGCQHDIWSKQYNGKVSNIGTLVARVSVQYQYFRDIECMNLMWTDLGGAGYG